MQLRSVSPTFDWTMRRASWNCDIRIMNECAMELLSLAGCTIGLASQRKFNSDVVCLESFRDMRWRSAVFATAAAFAISACIAAVPEPAEQIDFVPSTGARDMLATEFEPKGDPSSIEFGNLGVDRPNRIARI